MSDELATITYLMEEPFGQSLRSVRRILTARKLQIIGEFDISDRIRQKLLINTAPCMVLYVWPSVRLSESLGGDPGAAALAPLHVVVAGRGAHSEVHLLRTLPSDAGLLDRRTSAAVNQIQAEIAQAIEKIAMRVTLNA
jgi:uncharacterized protein (DUF302 family)